MALGIQCGRREGAEVGSRHGEVGDLKARIVGRHCGRN
jgi:hypothetical protein